MTVCETRVAFNSLRVVKRPKTQSSLRTLPLPDEVLQYLKKIQKQHEDNKILMGADYKDIGYVCCHSDGSLYDVGYVSKKFKDILESNKLPHIRFHDLRHSNASCLLRKGIPMKVIQVWLGHKDISTTMDIYAHIDIDMKKAGAEKINDVIKGLNM